MNDKFPLGPRSSSVHVIEVKFEPTVRSRKQNDTLRDRYNQILILSGQYNQNVRLSDISMFPEKTWVVQYSSIVLTSRHKFHTTSQWHDLLNWDSKKDREQFSKTLAGGLSRV